MILAGMVRDIFCLSPSSDILSINAAPRQKLSSRLISQGSY